MAPAEKVELDPMMLKVAEAVVTGGSGRHMRFRVASKEEKLA